MREIFFSNLVKLAREQNDIYLLTANLGFRLFDKFKAKHPDKFIDIGIAESNMIGIAAGLSLWGKSVYCYSIIPFLLMRAYEQIRQDIAYHKLNVTLIGAGAGLTYGMEGFTHHAIEDLALMRSMPNMNVVVPSNIISTEQLVRLSYDFPSPLYIRMGKGRNQESRFDPGNMKIGKGIILQEGRDIAIFVAGEILCEAEQTVVLLEEKGLSVTLIDMHTLKPLDTKLIQDCADNHKAIFTIEEHSIVGGLGSALSEVLAEYSYGGMFHRIGIPEEIKSVVGDANFLRRNYGLTADQITETVFNKWTDV